MDNSLVKIYKSKKTVYTLKDLALVWEENNQNNLKSKASYYVRKGDLVRLSRGVFAKDKEYDLKELASQLYKPSYVSFETVLREEGMIFQYYESVFSVGPWSKTILVNKNNFIYRQLKHSILLNPQGILNKEVYSQASKERAFLDMIYIFPNYYFDNLKALDWNRCFDLVEIYQNKQLIKRLHSYKEKYVK